MQQTFGVDIGNSGIRVTELLLPSRELGPMLRIDWWPDDRSSARLGTADPRRYRPDDSQWLSELDHFIDAHECPRPAGNSAQPPRWLISSVRRDALALLHDYLVSRQLSSRQLGSGFELQGGRQVEVITYTALPLDIRVDFPQAVGIDRLLAALAAVEFVNASPAVVIQAGSAVTVDLIHAPALDMPSLDETGRQTQSKPQSQSQSQSQSQPQSLGSFEGGAILPGVPMMLRLLGKGADQLPQITAADLLSLPELPGKNTEAAMICGAASALVGGVSHLVSRYRQQYGQSIPIIISGGDGMRLSPYLSAPLIIKDHLVHRGLMRLAEFKSLGKINFV